MQYTLARVFCQNMKDMADSLTHQHYDEVPFSDGAMPLNIDWDTFQLLEDNGCLLGLAAFDEQSNLVGYLVVITTPMLHHAGKFMAVTDCFYVHPDHRKKGVFELLLEQTREMCREAGVIALRVGVNENFPLDPEMLSKLGFSHAETIYQQEL